MYWICRMRSHRHHPSLTLMQVCACVRGAVRRATPVILFISATLCLAAARPIDLRYSGACRSACGVPAIVRLHYSLRRYRSTLERTLNSVPNGNGDGM